MALQLAFTLNAAIAIEGMLAEQADLNAGIISRFAEDGGGNVGIPVGRFVVKGTAQNQCKLPTAAGDVTNFLLGGAIYSPSRPPTPYPAKEPVSILRKGTMWMVTVNTIADETNTVFVVHSGVDAGKLRADAGGVATQAPAGVRVIKGAAALGFVMVEFNLPG